MKPLGYVIAFCVICAAIKAVTMALMLAIALAVVIGACTRPKETFGLLVFWLSANLIQTSPFIVLGAMAILAIASMFGISLARRD
jgi:hypothetical protein